MHFLRSEIVTFSILFSTSQYHLDHFFFLLSYEKQIAGNARDGKRTTIAKVAINEKEFGNKSKSVIVECILAIEPFHFCRPPSQYTFLRSFPRAFIFSL